MSGKTAAVPMTRILLADDHAAVRRALRRILAGVSAWEVCAEAADGQEAVAAAARHCPDIAVLDLVMPGLDGIEAARRIRAMLPDCEVALVTMHANAEVMRAAVAAGAKACLAKNDADPHLVPAVRSLLEKRQYFLPPPSQAFAAN